MLAPDVRSAGHTHPPEEADVVLTDGQFRQGVQGNWFTPGVGGTVYNVPGILHAMRSITSQHFLPFGALRDEKQ